MHFESPVAAALAGIPPQAVRVLAFREEADDAYVLLDARPEGPPYEYGVHCHRDADGWVEGSSSNSDGWTSTDPEGDLGTMTYWDRAPEGVTRVRVTFGGRTSEVPVEHGYFLATWWRMPCLDHDGPRVDAVLIGGAWRPATG